MKNIIFIGIFSLVMVWTGLSLYERYVIFNYAKLPFWWREPVKVKSFDTGKEAIGYIINLRETVFAGISGTVEINDNVWVFLDCPMCLLYPVQPISYGYIKVNESGGIDLYIDNKRWLHGLEKAS